MEDDRTPRESAARGSRVRAAATRVVERTLAERRPADLLLARAGRELEERDRRLLAELAYGSLRWKLRLESVIERASGRAVGRIDVEILPVLQVAAFQLLFLDRVPAHAAVSQAVDEARARRGRAAAGFVNAVLRRIASRPALESWPVEADDPVQRLAIETSHPPELVRRWVERWDFETAARVAQAGNSAREMHLLAFADRGGRERLGRRLATEGIATAPGSLSPLSLIVRAGRPLECPAFREGDFYVQDEASQAAALIPPPGPGERVLDAAAAPGGKGLAILAAEPGARVTFSDASPRRVAKLASNARRLGRRLAIAAADAGRPPWGAEFDRVVLDAPCSGTGTLRRHPELRWRFRPRGLDRLARSAGRLLEHLAPVVAPGGLLVHVTCSIEPEENEEVASRFLGSHQMFRPEPLEGLPGPLAEGRIGDGRWRILPGHGHDGFSVQVFRRVGS